MVGPGDQDPVTQARLRTALALAPIWVFEQDLRLHYTWLQNGETEGNAGGATDHDLMERADEAEIVVGIKARVLATGVAETAIVTAHVGGTPRQHRLYLEPIRDAQDRVRGLRGAILDLGAEVGPTSPTTNDLLRLIGHELRNAVNPVRMIVQLERRRAVAAKTKVGGLATAFAGVERLTRALEDMLDYAHSTTEPLAPQLGPVSIKQALCAARVRFAILYPQAEQRLTVGDFDADLVVLADGDRLQQSLLAMLERAARTTQSDQAIRVDVEALEDALRINIVDQGSGLPSGAQGHQDNPVRWAQAAIHEHRDEPPFAVALVGRLMRAMGGTFEVEPAVDRGTRATLTLKLALPEPRPRAASAKEAPPVPLRILVVDDAPGATQTLRWLLETDGHTVVEAGTGEGCLQALREASFDAVLLDLGLPDMGGHAVARQIRIGVNPVPALLALTGRSSERDRQESGAAGFDQHLVKPVDLAGLRSALAKL